MNAEEGGFESFLGITVDIQNLNIQGGLDPDSGVNLASAGIGITYGLVTKQTGFVFIVSLVLPIYNIFDGVVVSGSGFCSNIFLGFGTSIYYRPPLAEGDMTGLINLSGGIHSTIRTVIGQDFVLTEYTLGPSLNMYMGQRDGRFRINMTFWYDPIAYYTTNVKGLGGWANMNIGGAMVFGFRL